MNYSPCSDGLYFVAKRPASTAVPCCTCTCYTLGVLPNSDLRRTRSSRSRSGSNPRASHLATRCKQSWGLPTLLSAVTCVTMDPNGLDISEQSKLVLSSILDTALLAHFPQYGVLCRLYALPYCTPAAPPNAPNGSAPASSQHAAAASCHADAPVAARPRPHAAALLGPRLYDAARSCGSSATPALFAASRVARSNTPTT